MSKWEALYNTLQCCATAARAVGNFDKERAFLDALWKMDQIAEIKEYT